MKMHAWTPVFCAAVLLAAQPVVSAAPSPWRDISESSLRDGAGERVLFPLRYRLVALDAGALRETLAQAPLEFTPEASDTASAVVLALPMPDGAMGRFRVEESPIMEPALAARFPDIRTYRAQGLDDGSASARFGWTSAGFHAIILSEHGTTYIDPYRRGDTAHYISYFKRDYRAPAGDTFRCHLDDLVDNGHSWPESAPTFTPSGSTLRTYRLALAANVEYSDYHSTSNPPDRNHVLNNGLIPSMNRVNGVYERDLAIRMVLVAGQMDIIFVVEPDGYDNTSNMINVNQGIIDANIGNANYDIGHVFSTGGGGVAQLRVP